MQRQLRPVRILIVDADRSSRRALGSLLEEVGHRVGLSETWQEASKLARQTCYDLVIADLEPPGGSVKDGLAGLWAEPALRGVPIILLSRRGGVAPQLDRASVADSMTKPIDVGRMLSSIDSHARRQRVEPAAM